MAEPASKNLLKRPFVIDMSMVMLGALYMALPEHGVLEKWLALGNGIGLIIVLVGASKSFYRLFISADWIDEGRRHNCLTFYRGVWLISILVTSYIATVSL